MKVIHLISGGDTGGAKTHVHSLLRGLSEHITAEMVCFMDGPFAQEARELGIRVHIIRRKNPFAALKELQALAAREGFDLIHCHGSRGNMMGAMLGRRTGLPVVTTVHSDYRLDYMGRPVSRLTYGTINALALRCIPYHIGVSDATVDMLIERGFDPQRVFAIYNGLDFTPAAPALSRREFLASLGLDWPEDAVIVGIAARLNPVKDIATLIRGFALARKSAPRLRLLIAGDGPEEAPLKALAAELGQTDCVCFAGWVADTDSFYAALDINTLTSLSETFAYALTEGARFSLPTVATRVGGAPYLIDHGVNGLLFEPRDCEALGRHLADLARSPGLREKLGTRLREKASREFSLERTIERQLEIYDIILRRERRPKRGRDGVVICGAYGKGNAGDEAILEAILREMREIDPDMPLWVMTRRPEETRLRHRANAVYTFNIPAFTRRMARARLYVNGGGSLMQDVTSRRSLWFYLYTLDAARRRGCKVMMYGCGIGPIGYPSNRKRVRRTLNRSVDVITLRDRSSLDELAAMGVDRPHILVTADPTVILPAAAPETAESLLEAAGLRPGEQQHYLGIAVRPWQGFAEKAPVFAQAADYAYETYGLIPVFLPIEASLDVPAARQVAAHIRKAPCAVLPAAASSGQTIALFARMDVVLSMRLHALVFAAGQGVPLVGVVYDPKVSSFLDCLGQDLYTPFAPLSFAALRPLLDEAAARSRDRERLEAGVRRLLLLEKENSAQARLLLSAGEETGEPEPKGGQP